MNVLLIVNELRYTCGVTNHILHLTRGLQNSGKVNVWIIAGGGNGIERFKDINVNIITDKRFHHKSRTIPNFISAVTFLAKFSKKNKIDIIHSHTHFAANIAAKASRITGIKTIQTNHGLLTHKGRLKHFNASKYISINEHIYNYIIKNRIADEKNIKFIRCGIPVDETPPAKNKDTLKVIAASRFTYEKGLDLYIRAVSELNSDIRQKAEFYIAGEGELNSALIDLNNNLNAGINFLGQVENLYPVLRESHIFVYPSRSKSEGFPAVITEAGATANLVLSSDFDGVEYVIQDNVDGIIFKNNNNGDLKDKLEEIINNYDRYTQFAQNFYSKVRTLYDLNTMIDKHIELYSDCLKK